MGNRYKKTRIGIHVERSFVRNFWKRGIPALRIPASGAAASTPRPDVLVFSNSYILCIELKTSSKDRVVYKREDWEKALKFAEALKKQGFNTIPYLVFHPKGTRKYIWIEIPKEAYEKNKKLVIENRNGDFFHYWLDNSVNE